MATIGMGSRSRYGKVTIEVCGDGKAEQGMSKARRWIDGVVTNGETFSLGTG